MKKRLLAMLSLLMAALLLSGCGSYGAQALNSTPSTESRPDTLADIEAFTVDTVVSSGSAAAAGENLITLRDSGSEAQDGSVRIDGATVTITEAGSYRLSGTLSNGQIAIRASEEAKVKLILDGADISCQGSAAIYAVSASKLVVSTAAGSSNRISSVGEFIQTDDNTVDAAIFTKCDLTFNGEGSLAISSETKHGAVSKDDMKIKSGTISIVAHTDAIQVKDKLTVEGGELYLTAGDDGIHADELLAVNGGEIYVLSSYEGLEAQDIVINDGLIRITASDDGINAAGGSDSSNHFGFSGGPFASDSGSSLTINGGLVYVNAEGDGLDANGELLVTGGSVYVSGPTNNGNGALDYGTSATITGGTVIAAGASGMAENFGSQSTQGSILLNLPSTASAGSTVSISDENGELLASYAPEKSFESVVISTEGLVIGGTYTVTVGSYSTSITLDSLIYGSGMGGHGGHGAMGGRGEFGGMGGPGDSGDMGMPGDFGDMEPPEDFGGMGGPGGHGGMGGGPHP